MIYIVDDIEGDELTVIILSRCNCYFCCNNEGDSVFKNINVKVLIMKLMNDNFIFYI